MTVQEMFWEALFTIQFVLIVKRVKSWIAFLTHWPSCRVVDSIGNFDFKQILGFIEFRHVWTEPSWTLDLAWANKWNRVLTKICEKTSFYQKGGDGSIYNLYMCSFFIRHRINLIGQEYVIGKKQNCKLEHVSTRVTKMLARTW